MLRCSNPAAINIKDRFPTAQSLQVSERRHKVKGVLV
jgi:hypothetical protein